jgi:hypothetical protein
MEETKHTPGPEDIIAGLKEANRELVETIRKMGALTYQYESQYEVPISEIRKIGREALQKHKGGE